MFASTAELVAGSLLSQGTKQECSAGAQAGMKAHDRARSTTNVE
jgi:hypothetical protein